METFGNLELFLIQMLVLFAAAQAVTEALKQTLFAPRLVHTKRTPEEIETREQLLQEQQRQAQVRRLAWWSGTLLAFVAQINPLATLAPQPLWEAVQPVAARLFGAGLLTEGVVIGARVLNYAIVGYLAVYGAPLFNDLLNIVRTFRTNAGALRSAAAWRAGQQPSREMEELLARAIYDAHGGTISLEKAREQAKKYLAA